MRQCAKAELKYIQDFTGIEALYLETLKVALQLVEPNRLNTPNAFKHEFGTTSCIEPTCLMQGKAFPSARQ